MVGQFHFKAQWGCFSQWHGAVEISTYYYYCCHYLHHLASIRGCWRCHHWHFGIRSIPVLPQQHVKDTGHSDKSAGGRLQLNTHAPNVCGFAWSDMTWCMVYTECAKMAAVSCSTSHVTTKQHCKYNTSVIIQKNGAIKSYSHSSIITCCKSAGSLLESREKCYIKVTT